MLKYDPVVQRLVVKLKRSKTIFANFVDASSFSSDIPNSHIVTNRQSPIFL